MKITCLDRGVFRRKAVKTAEGFLKVDAIVTRTGVFHYLKPTGRQKQLRHPDDVFSSDSLDSLKMIPVTLNHPQSVLVTAEDAKDLSVGFTGESVRPDGENLVVSLKITDSKAIEAIESGKNELSLGYTLDLVDAVGEYNGDSYDKKQTNIKYNHLAIVDRARAGENAKIHLDSADVVSIQIDEVILNIDNSDNNDNNDSSSKKPKGVHMFKVNIDGVGHEVDNVEIAKHVAKLTKNIDKAGKDLAASKKEVEKVTAEKDGLEEKVKKLSEVDHSKAITDGVAARLELERGAVSILGDSVGEGEKAVKVSSMDEADIKKAVIAKIYPKRNIDGKSDEYVSTLFSCACDEAEENKGDDDDDDSNFDSHFEEMNKDGLEKGSKNTDSARSNMIKNRGKKAE